MVRTLQRGAKVEPSLRYVGDNGGDFPPDSLDKMSAFSGQQCRGRDYLHHVLWSVNCPHHQVLARSFALQSEPRGTSGQGEDQSIHDDATNFCPSAEVRAPNAIEKASQSAQKYLRAMYGLFPMYERRQ